MAVSTDEGNTWSTLNNFSNGNIYTIDFSHDNKGVVVGENGIFKTKDNGLTWHQAESDLNTVDDMLFIEENIVVLLSGGHIYKSIDGGETTRIVLTTEQAGSYLPAGKFYLTPGNILFSVSWYATYKSDDLGETWELISTEQGIYIQKMHFISPSIGYRVELFGSVEKTIDGGITWVEIFTRDQEQSKPFNAIYFINETVGYKGGDILQRTTDGGISWEKVDWMFYEIMAIHFENLDHGFVVTRGGIVYETNDAGSTWERIFQTSSRLFDVQFVNNGIFLAGEDGFIARRNTTPTPPSQPGYIYGSNRVCAGDAIEFSIAVNSDYRTQWSTTAGNIEDHTEYITVNFPDPGTYTITAKHFNLCGVSESRSTTITVSAPPETPIIEGPNPSLLGEQGVEYSVINGLEGSEYLWEAEGSASVLPTENGVVIDWTDQVEGGLIKVLEVDTHGCRAYGTLSVTLDVPVGLEGNLNDQVSIYPNPTAWDTQITSSFGGLLFVRIKDSLGREFSTTTLSGMEDQTLLTRKLSSGLYFIEISDGRHVVIKKLIKE